MRIVVMGGGVVGMATAYYLGEDGHQVILIERRGDLACETSHANAGLVCPGGALAWASPAALGLFLRALAGREAAIRVKARLDPRLWWWGRRFLAQCTSARARANGLLRLRLALYSRHRLNALAADTGIDFDARRQGIAYFFRSQQSLDRAAADLKLLADHGLALEVVSRDELVGIEPALAAAKQAIAGGIFSPMDQTGDAAKFTRALAAWCSQHRGLRFAFATEVERLAVEGGRVVSAVTDRGTFAADAFVLAAGCDTPLLARPLGIRLAVYPVKGYSITLPVGEGDVAPAIGGADEDRHIAFSRLGQRLRITTGAEFAGNDASYAPGDFRHLLAAARDLFPRGGDYGRASYWACLRPMTPGSVPVLGQARYPNLYLNVGHGDLGWTLAAGSGKLVADLLAGRRPEINPDGLLYAG